MNRGRVLGILCAVVLLSACVSSPGVGTVGGWDWNISDETERWGGYHPQGIYRLQQDVFLANIEDRTNGSGLVPDVDADVPRGTPRAPTTIAGYRGDSRPWPWIEDIIPSGTRVRATRLRSKGNLRARSATVVYVKAQIIDGAHRGKVVDLQPLSLYRVDAETGVTTLVGPNEDFLLRAN